MEQNNIENQFKEKLSKREIKPSAISWDRLDAMLALAEKPKRNYKWMYFAASFLGFILIATVFLSQTEEAIDAQHQPVVIEQNAIQNQKDVLENNVKIQNKTAVEAVVTPEVAVIYEKISRKKSVKTTQKSAAELPRISALAAMEKNNKATSICRKSEIRVDANALLASIEKTEIVEAVAKNTVAIKVNTGDLLSHVDNELELSFREKVIKSVNKKYKEVKVAVINRNLQ